MSAILVLGSIPFVLNNSKQWWLYIYFSVIWKLPSLCNWVFCLDLEREMEYKFRIKVSSSLSWFGSGSHCTKWGFNLICLDKNILVNLFHWIQVLVVLNSIFYSCQLFWFCILLVWFIPHSKNISLPPDGHLRTHCP